MARLSLPLSLVMFFTLVRLIESQCVTSTYVPCYPNDDAVGGSGGVPEDDFDDSEFWDTLQGVASAPIGKRGVLRPLLSSRQNALCCPPTNQCLVLTDGNIPFCYVSDAAPALPLLLETVASRLPPSTSTSPAKAKKTGLGHNRIPLLGRQLWLSQ